MCVCVFFQSILNIKFVGRISRGHTGERSHRISHPPSFCGACLNFSREKDQAVSFPRRPYEREDSPALRDKTPSPLKHPLQEPTFNFKKNKQKHSGNFIRNERCLAKASSPSGFVSMAVCWLLDSVYWILGILRSTNYRSPR